MRSKVVLLVVMLAGAISATAQNRYVVFFSDKTGSPFTISQPGQFLSPRAIARRIQADVVISEEDLPVSPSYVQQVKGAGAQVHYASRWLNAVLIQATPAVAAAIDALPFVPRVELVAPGAKLSGGRTRRIKQGKQTAMAAATKSQLEMVAIDDMHGDELTGNGILVAVFDGGFQGVNTALPFQHLFNEGRIADTHDFVANSSDIYRYDDHGTEVLSVMAALSGTYTGGAHQATYQLYVTEDPNSEYRIEEFNWLFAAERADSAGADVIHSSLGYNTFDDPSMDYNKNTDLNGRTAIVSIAAAEAIERGVLVVVSAGNEGNVSWGLVTPPADVDGVIAVGAVTSQGVRSSFSSRGPTSDGRTKPDVSAQGSSTAVIRPSGANGTTSGTSMSAPIVTSLAVGLLQRYPDLPAHQIVDAIIGSGSQADTPDNLLGHGIPNYVTARHILDTGTTNDPISFYPNPSDSTVNILLKQVNIDTDVMIFDMNGKMLNEKRVRVTWSNNPLVVDVSMLAPGTYLVKVKTINNFKTFRLIKI